MAFYCLKMRDHVGDAVADGSTPAVGETQKHSSHLRRAPPCFRFTDLVETRELSKTSLKVIIE